MSQMEALKVQDDAYLPVVETLASILEQRDKTHIEYTNKGGSTNRTKNPLLVLWDDLNKSALTYWRDLGLTPSSYKKMTGDSPKNGVIGGLEEALKKIETG